MNPWGTTHDLVYVSDALMMAGACVGCSSAILMLFIATDQEVDEVVTEYRQHARNGFSAEELQFAKAVCCLKLICAVKVGHG